MPTYTHALPQSHLNDKFACTNKDEPSERKIVNAQDSTPVSKVKVARAEKAEAALGTGSAHDVNDGEDEPSADARNVSNATASAVLDVVSLCSFVQEAFSRIIHTVVYLG